MLDLNWLGEATNRVEVAELKDLTSNASLLRPQKRREVGETDLAGRNKSEEGAEWDPMNAEGEDREKIADCILS